MTPKKRPGFFQLPAFKPNSSRIGGLRAQIIGSGSSTSSAERVLRETPSLKALYEFLARPKP
jgi:hypothetical protein